MQGRKERQSIFMASMAAAEQFARNSHSGGYLSRTRRAYANLAAFLMPTAA